MDIKQLIMLVEGIDDNDHAKALRDTGFWGKQGAGFLFFAKSTGRFLIGYRSGNVEQPHTWGTFGGAIDSGENPAKAGLREAEEEIGFNGKVQVVPIYIFRKNDFSYFNFIFIS